MALNDATKASIPPLTVTSSSSSGTNDGSGAINSHSSGVNQPINNSFGIVSANGNPVSSSTGSHLHLPHLHQAGQFLRENFMGGSASAALSALMGHHGTLAASPAVVNEPISHPSGSQSAGVLNVQTAFGFNTPISSSNAMPSIMDQQPLATVSSNQVAPTPPLQRRLAKSFSVAPNLTQQKGAIFFTYIVYDLHFPTFFVSINDIIL